MPTNIDHYLAIIKDLQPDLAMESVVFYDEGLINDVVVVNQSAAFRFVKDDSAV